MVPISYTGFLRMLAGHEMLQIPLMFSHTFEVTTSSLPLMAIQMFNNRNLDKFQYPLDYLNLIFTIFSLIDLLAQLFVGQLMKPESDYTLLSRRRIGLREDNGGATDNESDIDSQVESDGDVSSQHPSTHGSEVPIGKKGMSASKLQEWVRKFRSEESKFREKEDLSNHDYLFVFMISVFAVAIFSLIQYKALELLPCGINKYEQDNFCYDCI